MECLLGRPLDFTEVVHHKDGDHTNDSPDNLEVLSPSEHTKRHIEEHRARGSVWPMWTAERSHMQLKLRINKDCDSCGKPFPAHKLTTCRKCKKRDYDKIRYEAKQTSRQRAV